MTPVALTPSSNCPNVVPVRKSAEEGGSKIIRTTGKDSRSAKFVGQPFSVQVPFQMKKETTMKAKRRWFLTAAILLVVPLLFASYSRGDRDEAQFQWDLISGDAYGNLRPGGQDSAAAADKSTLTLTGSGTFQVGDPEDVTGGGTWTLGTSSGTYHVTRLVRFTLAPCSVPSCVSGFGGTDLVGIEQDARAGLVVLEIKYSDGSRGVLFVSCMLNATPAAVYEGITASKGYVEYWDQSVNNSNVNGTIFHVLHR
jgi:hypothetical protein